MSAAASRIGPVASQTARRRSAGGLIARKIRTLCPADPDSDENVQRAGSEAGGIDLHSGEACVPQRRGDARRERLGGYARDLGFVDFHATESAMIPNAQVARHAKL